MLRVVLLKCKAPAVDRGLLGYLAAVFCVQTRVPQETYSFDGKLLPWSLHAAIKRLVIPSVGKADYRFNRNRMIAAIEYQREW